MGHTTFLLAPVAWVIFIPGIAWLSMMHLFMKFKMPNVIQSTDGHEYGK